MSENKSAEGQPDDRVVCEIDISSDRGFQELKTLTKDSRFVCRDCGRTAASDESLCRPEWIY